MTLKLKKNLKIQDNNHIKTVGYIYMVVWNCYSVFDFNELNSI